MLTKFLGTGGVFDYKYGNSSLTIDCGRRVLIDCGPLVFPRLVELSIIDSIDYLLLTHLHGDHTGSIFQLSFYTMGVLKHPLKILYATDAFRKQIETLLAAQGVPPTHFVMCPLQEVSEIRAFDTTNKHAVGVISFAYLFDFGGEKVFYSGDLGDINVTKAILADIKPSEVIVFHEMHHKEGKAHVHYSELNRLMPKYNVFGYHCNPDLIPSDNNVPLVADQKPFLW